MRFFCAVSSSAPFRITTSIRSTTSCSHKAKQTAQSIHNIIVNTIDQQATEKSEVALKFYIYLSDFLDGKVLCIHSLPPLPGADKEVEGQLKQ